MAEKDKEPNLLDLFRGLLDDHLGKEEFVKSFQIVAKAIEDLKAGNIQEFEAIHATVDALGQKLTTDTTSSTEDLKREVREALAAWLAAHDTTLQGKLSEADTRLAAVKDGADGGIGPQGPQG